MQDTRKAILDSLRDLTAEDLDNNYYPDECSFEELNLDGSSTESITRPAKGLRMKS